MVVFKEGPFTVVTAKGGFIAYNVNKEWESGHTHLQSKKRAKDLIRCVKQGCIPRHFDLRCLWSLYRLSDDPEYQNKLQELVRTRKQKGKKLAFYNKSGRRRRSK